jgi:hypothetical protein
MVLDEVADDPADPVLLAADDGRVGNRETQGMAEQRRDREPIGQRADHSRLGESAHETHPGVAALQQQRAHKQQCDCHQQPGGEQLHPTKLELARGI